MPEVPNRVVTVMSTVPAPVPVACGPDPADPPLPAVPVLGGLATTSCVPESEMIVPPTRPKRTTVASPRPVPVSVTLLPPTVLPLAGDTPVTAGSVTGRVREAGLDPV